MNNPINPDIVTALLALAETREVDRDDCDDCLLADNLCFSEGSDFMAACDWAITQAKRWLGNIPYFPPASGDSGNA